MSKGISARFHSFAPIYRYPSIGGFLAWKAAGLDTETD
jgi:hypothetical protein